MINRHPLFLIGQKKWSLSLTFLPKTILKLGFQAKEILLFYWVLVRWRRNLKTVLNSAKFFFKSLATVLTSKLGRILEFLIGGPNFGSERTAELFLWQIIITSHRDDHSFLNLWTPVIVGAGNTALQADANTSKKGTQKQLHFWITLEFGLAAKCNRVFH